MVLIYTNNLFQTKIALFPFALAKVLLNFLTFFSLSFFRPHFSSSTELLVKNQMKNGTLCGGNAFEPSHGY
jgi:hypothetical protein